MGSQRVYIILRHSGTYSSRPTRCTPPGPRPLHGRAVSGGGAAVCGGRWGAHRWKSARVFEMNGSVNYGSCHSMSRGCALAPSLCARSLSLGSALDSFLYVHTSANYFLYLNKANPGFRRQGYKYPTPKSTLPSLAPCLFVKVSERGSSLGRPR